MQIEKLELQQLIELQNRGNRNAGKEVGRFIIKAYNMKIERVRISHEDYMKGKYRSVSTGSELTDPHDGTSSVTYHEVNVYYNDDGSINEEMTYSQKAQKQQKEDKKKNKQKKEAKSEKEGCLTKILLAPFRLLWKAIKWLLKTVLIIVSAGLLKGILEGDSK